MTAPSSVQLRFDRPSVDEMISVLSELLGVSPVFPVVVWDAFQEVLRLLELVEKPESWGQIIRVDSRLVPTEGTTETWVRFEPTEGLLARLAARRIRADEGDGRIGGVVHGGEV